MALPKKQINDRNKLVAVKRFLMSIPAGAELHRLIAEAAYHKWEQRGCEPGFADQDWMEAEKQILGSLRVL
jgi:hypothetical protein